MFSKTLNAIFDVSLLLIMAVSVLLLMGCASAEKIPVRVPVEVKVPVMVPCIEQKDLPAMPVLASTKVQGHESDCELVNMVLTDRAQLKLYADQLQAVLAGCVNPASSRRVNQLDRVIVKAK